MTQTKFVLEKVIDNYYSDKSYVIVKLSLINEGFNFKEGDRIEIRKLGRKK